jgi:hypothetical protein
LGRAIEEDEHSYNMEIQSMTEERVHKLKETYVMIMCQKDMMENTIKLFEMALSDKKYDMLETLIKLHDSQKYINKRMEDSMYMYR